MVIRERDPDLIYETPVERDHSITAVVLGILLVVVVGLALYFVLATQQGRQMVQQPAIIDTQPQAATPPATTTVPVPQPYAVPIPTPVPVTQPIPVPTPSYGGSAAPSSTSSGASSSHRSASPSRSPSSGTNTSSDTSSSSSSVGDPLTSSPDGNDSSSTPSTP